MKLVARSRSWQTPIAADIKPSVDVISALLPLIKEKVPDGAKISQATRQLANLLLTSELQTQASGLVKQSDGIRAAIGKAAPTPQRLRRGHRRQLDRLLLQL